MIKKFDLPTFSINPKATDDKHRRIFKLIAQVNESNRETLGEAFIRIMEDKKPKSDYAALDKYSKTRIKYQSMEEARKEIISLEEQLEELELKDVTRTIPTITFENDAIRRCDTDYIVKQFLDFRQKWYFEDGKDILRLLELGLFNEDIQAIWILKWLFEDKREMEFLKELLETPEAIDKIRDRFWS